MLEILVGSLMGVFGFTETFETKPQPDGTINIINRHWHQAPSDRQTVVVQPMAQLRYRNLIRQAYDYSCGSAALTTLLDYYLGRNLKEQQVMEGLIKYGEPEKIVARRGFSLLDMKRYVAALGYKSGGFKATFEDLETLEHPAIVPIEYAGFKHFVVVRDVYDNHVFVADPALGNISFTAVRFQEIWDQDIIFMIYPTGNEPRNALALSDVDLRVVDDRTANLLAFREFPLLSKFQNDNLTRASTDKRTQYIRRR